MCSPVLRLKKGLQEDKKCDIRKASNIFLLTVPTNVLFL